MKKNLINEKLVTLKSIPLPAIDKENSLQISNLDNQIALLEKAQNNKYSVSEKIINEIILKKIPDIKINGISYDRNSIGGEGSVNIRGIAKSREKLLLFRKVLEEDPLFKKVDLPISNFVKGSNISFNLTLTPF